MHAIGIIPARMGSIRFPGKPLAMIAGKPMIQWVAAAAARARTLETVIVATDDDRIRTAAAAVHVSTFLSHRPFHNGTERVAAAAEHTGADVVLNIQGDEPMIHPESLDDLARAFEDPAVQIASLYFKPETAAFIADRNRVKVLVNEKRDAVLFTRSVLQSQAWRVYGQHIGIYAYRRSVLEELAKLPPNPSLEQGAWMDAGYKVRMVETAWETIAVDQPEDIQLVEKALAGQLDRCPSPDQSIL